MKYSCYTHLADEEAELDDRDHEAAFPSKRDEILRNSKEFTFFDDVALDAALAEADNNAPQREGELEDDPQGHAGNEFHKYHLDDPENEIVC